MSGRTAPQTTIGSPRRLWVSTAGTAPAEQEGAAAASAARSAPALVATCTATLGLHSSSSPTSSYSYFGLGSALRSFTASSAELRAPMPLAATPPVSGPMKATLALSLAAAGNDAKVTTTARPTDAAMADSPFFLIISRYPSGGNARRPFASNLHDARGCRT